MALTPKPIRREIRRARREAQRYLGEKIHHRLVRGNENVTVTRNKHGRVQGTVTLNRRFLSSSEARKVAQHEYFHAGHDTGMLRKSGKTVRVVSEAIAIISNIEHLLTSTGGAYREVLDHFHRQYRVNPPENPVHRGGLQIAVNILIKFPRKKDRMKYIRELMKRNAKAISTKKPGEQVTVDALGNIE